MKVYLSGPIKGVRKSYGLWVESGVQFQPLVYFQKPKWIKDDATWENFIRGVFMAISPEGHAALNEMLESVVLDRELEKALKDIRSLSSINSAMNPSPLALTVLLGDIHQIADTVLSKEMSND